MCQHCYFREHISVAAWAEKNPQQNGMKRILDLYFCFFIGISALCLARDTKQDRWRTIGENSVQTMMQLEQCSTWNFENKLLLLQAGLYHLNERHALAEISYQSAIISAHEHRFTHEESLAQELYGIYLVENKYVKRGLDQLKMAKNNYNQWGALSLIHI